MLTGLEAPGGLTEEKDLALGIVALRTTPPTSCAEEEYEDEGNLEAPFCSFSLATICDWFLWDWPCDEESPDSNLGLRGEGVGGEKGKTSCEPFEALGVESSITAVANSSI